MSVTRITRWTGGTRADVVAAVNTSRPYIERLGGRLEAKQIHDGHYAGQWITWRHFPDLETHERAERLLATDTAYQEAMVKPLSKFQVADRWVVVGIDL